MPEFIPYGRQQIDDDDIAAVTKVLRSDFLTTGPAVGHFESVLSDKTGAKYAIACANGTAALHLSTMALGLGPGDAVVVPAVTFLATANAVRFAGAEVVFSDVDPETGLMESDHLEEALERISDLTPRAVIPVDLNGQCVDLVTINKVAEHAGITIIMDSCHSIGARFTNSDGKLEPVGSGKHAAMTCFSFHPVKTVAMGEGGAVTTNDPVLADRLQRLRNHGMTRDSQNFTEKEQAFASDSTPFPWYYEMPELGYNYRASDLHCALGSSQLAKLQCFVTRRRYLVDLYDQLLSPFSPTIKPPSRVSGCEPAWHLCVVRIDFTEIEKERAVIVKELLEKGIGTQVHYLPVNRQPYYKRRYGSLQLPGANIYYDQVLSLPLFPGMTDNDVAYVVNTLIYVTGVG